MPFLGNTEDIGKDDRLDVKKVRLREDSFFFPLGYVCDVDYNYIRIWPKDVLSF